VIVSSAYEHAPTQTVDVGGTSFAYRRLGTETGVPVIFLHHPARSADGHLTPGTERCSSARRPDHLAV
jgi:hypothetical protein